MIELTLNEFLRISEGELISGYKDVLFKGVSTDTRDLTPGEAFFALKGENFDGHDFVQEAFNNGAAVAVVEQSIGHISEDYPIIKVGSTLQALQKLAEWWRRRFDIPVIGITGSSGKTTTKDILSSILEVKMNVHKTWGNFNNEIGVPLTLLGLDNHHDVCVVEMAMRGLGEIWELCGIAYPTMGIITNIGSAHYERLGSMENIAKAKGELARSIPQGGLVMLNGDDRWSSYIAVITAGRVMSYGFGEGAQLRARKIKSTSTGTIFTFDYQNGSHAMRLPLLG
ncbi:MAG: UDP-N-acetylmuramoyl-tripeptide--D-alanyl-D-alanine ligase, partial [Clostridia bacterium]|nr:UDP-N-acetylmuramoyl-tripeptide--D-alanyl-D-alanine ligase [Clostridia bacterium]